MTDEEKSARFAAISFMVAAVVGTVFLIGAIAWAAGGQSAKRSFEPHAHAMSAKDQANHRCRKTDPDDTFDCIFDEVERSDETSRSELELTAQQWSATAAIAAAGVSLFALIATVWGLLYVRRTYEEARKVTAAAQTANDVARSTAYAETRPWLTVEDVTFCPVVPDMPGVAEIAAAMAAVPGAFLGAGPLSVAIKIRNQGRTPAVKAGVRVKYFKIDDPELKKFLEDDEGFMTSYKYIPFVSPDESQTVQLFSNIISSDILISPTGVFCIAVVLRYRAVGSERMHVMSQQWTAGKEVFQGALQPFNYDSFIAGQVLPATQLQHTARIS